MTTTAKLLFAVSLLLPLTACDPGEDPVEARSAELDAPTDVDGARDHGPHAKGERAKFAVTKLCEEIRCDEAQTEAITALFAKRHAKRHDERESGDHEAHKAARTAANAEIAAAFQAEEFDATVLDRVKPERDHDAHEAEMIAFASELHGLLTPEQRGLLADRIAERGPMLFGGHHKGGEGRHHKGGEGRHHEGEGRHHEGEGHDGPRAKGHGDPSARLDHKVERMCEELSCTAEQQTQLRSTFEGMHDDRKEAHESRTKPDFSPVADLFRADELDADALRSALAAGRVDHEQRKAEHGKQFGTVVAEIHDILTPEQRAIVAKRIEADGLHALMGGKGHKAGKRGKRGKRGERGEHSKGG